MCSPIRCNERGEDNDRHNMETAKVGMDLWMETKHSGSNLDAGNIGAYCVGGG